MELENLDEYGTCKVNLLAKCPDCNGRMTPQMDMSAWTEDKDLVVIPTECEACKFSGVILVKLNETTNPNQ